MVGDGSSEQFLDYCASDVAALIALAPRHGAERSIGRGQNFAGVTWPRSPAWSGTASRSMLRSINNWWLTGTRSKHHLIAEVDKAYGVYENGSFKQALFEQYLQVNGIPWPRLPSGGLGARRHDI